MSLNILKPLYTAEATPNAFAHAAEDGVMDKE